MRLKLALLNRILNTLVVQAGIASINYENGGAFYFMRANKRRIVSVLIPFLSFFSIYCRVAILKNLSLLSYAKRALNTLHNKMASFPTHIADCDSWD